MVYLSACLGALILFSDLAAGAPAEPEAQSAKLNNIEFLAPGDKDSAQSARFSIRATLRFAGPVTGYVIEAAVNGKLLYQADQPDRGAGLVTMFSDGKALAQHRFTNQQVLQVRWEFPWRAKETYRPSITIRTDKSETFKITAQPALAPAGGLWRDDLNGYKLITVTETTDLDRGPWPILIRIDTDEQALADPKQQRFLLSYNDQALNVPVPFQELAVHEPDVGQAANNDDAGDSLELCFLANLKAGVSRRYLLYYGKPRQQIARAQIKGPRLRYRGKGFGVTVDTGPALFRFDPRSGQLLSYTPKLARGREAMFFRQKRANPIHWNPDVWEDGRSWGHTSDWDSRKPELRPDFRAARGPIVYRSVRRGPMPRTTGVQTVVSYTMFAGMPFILESSSVRFTVDTQVKAVRHNELVFSRAVHTHAVWPDASGAPAVKRIYDKQRPKKFFGNVARLAPDIPWLGLFHDEQRYGIAVVNLWHRNTAPADTIGPRDEGAHYYVLDSGLWGADESYDKNFTYLCRALVYPKNPVLVPKGAVYAERSAFVTFGLDPDSMRRFDELQRWVKLLRQPPKVVMR